MRPGQWPKNLLVALPCLAAHRLDLPVLAQTLLAFAALCLAASAIYALNDSRDVAQDRLHAVKSARPVAAAEVTVAQARLLGLVLGLAALAMAALGGPGLLGAVAAYLALSLAYMALKRRAVLDLVALALLYVLRVVAGAQATGIPPSVWLLAFCLLFFFALAALKRQAELLARLRSAPGDTACLPGRGYRPVDLPAVTGMAIGAGYAAVLVLVLYLQSAEVTMAYRWPAPLWGACVIVLYWISRAFLLTGRGRITEDAVAFALRDGVTWACLAGIAALAIIAR